MRTQTLGPLCLMLVTLTACPEAQVLVPTSLNSPRAMVVARGERVCLDPVLSQGLFSPRLRSCFENERAEMGLVVNDQIIRVSLLGWAQDETWPRTIDTDQATPGQTHIRVHGGLGSYHHQGSKSHQGKAVEQHLVQAVHYRMHSLSTTDGGGAGRLGRRLGFELRFQFAPNI